MPPIIIPVAIAAATAVAGVAAGVTTIAAGAIAVGATALAAGASYLAAQNLKTVAAMSPRGIPILSQRGSAVTSFANASSNVNASRVLTLRQALPPRRLAYGRLRVGGVVLLQQTNNPYLVIVTAVSDGPIDAFEELYLGEERVALSGGNAASGTRWFGNLSADFGLGDISQTRSAIVATRFPDLGTEFRQQGVARGVVQFNWGSDASIHNFLWGASIEPAFLIRGVKVYDPRDAGQDIDDPATWAYSDNPALCVAHAMTHAWRLALPKEYINWDSVAEAADDCDVTINIGGEALPLFGLAGIVQSDASIAQQLTDMLSAFNGAIIYTGDGLFSLKADKNRSSVWTITDLDILAIEDFAHGMEADNVFTAVKAVYFDAQNEGRQISSPVLEVDDPTVLPRETSVPLPFTPASHSAQILAWRQLHNSREGISVVLRLRDAAAMLDPTDVVTISSRVMPWVNGAYAITQVDLADVGCIVALRKVPSQMYRDPTEYVI